MGQLHIRAKEGEIAPFVLLPGDPARARLIAETFFEAPRLYNDHRGLLGFSGLYEGLNVSVQTTGMGTPSLAIVVEELIRLGARTLVRVGTCGIISQALEPGDLVVATASASLDGTTRQYLAGAPFAPTASFRVTRALVEAAEAAGRKLHVGPVQTEDAFYATTPDDVRRLEALGVLAVEMEAAALFTLGALRGARTGCLLIASNHIGDPAFIAPEILQEGVFAMTKTALEAALSLEARA